MCCPQGFGRHPSDCEQDMNMPGSMNFLGESASYFGENITAAV
jgi:hypothetical protein